MNESEVVAFTVWVCHWTLWLCGCYLQAPVKMKIMFLSLFWDIIKVCKAFWYPSMKDDILRWQTIIKYHRQVQDSKQLPFHILQIQQWDLDVSTSLLTPGKVFLALPLCWRPLSEPFLHLWQLDWQGCDSFAQPCHCHWMNHPDWTCQISSQGHPRELSWQVVSFLGLSVFAGQKAWKATKEGRESSQCFSFHFMSGCSREWVRAVRNFLPLGLITAISFSLSRNSVFLTFPKGWVLR